MARTPIRSTQLFWASYEHKGGIRTSRTGDWAWLIEHRMKLWHASFTQEVWQWAFLISVWCTLIACLKLCQGCSNFWLACLDRPDCVSIAVKGRKGWVRGEHWAKSIHMMMPLPTLLSWLSWGDMLSRHKIAINNETLWRQHLLLINNYWVGDQSILVSWADQSSVKLSL